MTRDFIGNAKQAGLTTEHKQRLRTDFRQDPARVAELRSAGHSSHFAREIALRERACEGIRDAKSLNEVKEALLAFVLNVPFKYGGEK